jgi:hypothetical protein
VSVGTSPGQCWGNFNVVKKQRRKVAGPHDRKQNTEANVASFIVWTAYIANLELAVMAVMVGTIDFKQSDDISTERNSSVHREHAAKRAHFGEKLQLVHP